MYLSNNKQTNKMKKDTESQALSVSLDLRNYCLLLAHSSPPPILSHHEMQINCKIIRAHYPSSDLTKTKLFAIKSAIILTRSNATRDGRRVEWKL